MDWNDPATWKAALTLLGSTWPILLPAFAVAMGAAYWFGTRVAGAGKVGLETTITGLDAAMKAREAQLDLARDKENDIQRKLSDATQQIGSLKARIAVLPQTADREILTSSTESVSETIGEAYGDTGALREILATPTRYGHFDPRDFEDED